ncbi:MAG: stalk domain-containing protein [Deltaproteobacteria bacterium]
MKRASSLTIFMVMIMLLCGSIPAGVQAAGEQPIKLFVNGQQIATDVDPIIIDNRTMVPLRVIADNLDRYVLWDGDNRRVIISRDAYGSNTLPSRAWDNSGSISIIVDGNEIESEVPPFIREGRTMVPIRVIAEGLGMLVSWDTSLRSVCIDEPPAVEPEEMIPVTPQETMETVNNMVDPNTTIMGNAQASAVEMKGLLLKKNPEASPEIVDLYLEIGEQYGVRGDIAFCQAAKETAWWRFTGQAQAFQNNFCGLGVTGIVATGNEDLRGADPAKVSYQPGVYGPVFDTPATGVEAHIQHLYAYAVKDPLPAGKTLVDPRFVCPARGCAPCWVDLTGRWAGDKTYGLSILNDYYAGLFTDL